MRFNPGLFFVYAEELGLLLGADGACGLYTPAHRFPDGPMLPHQYALKMRYGRPFDRNIQIGVCFTSRKAVSAERAVDELALMIVPHMGRVIKAALKGTGNDAATIELEARQQRNADRSLRRWRKKQGLPL